MRDKVAWGDEHEDTDEECCRIEEQDEGDADFHGGLTDIVGLWVERDDASCLLQGDNAKAQDIAQQQSLADNEGGKPQEGVTDSAVAGS